MIRSNVGSGVTNILTSDSTLYTQPNSIDRYHIGAANVYNPTGSTIVLSVFISPDLTSASGDLVDTISVATGQETDINSIVGQGYTNLNVIVKGSVAGLNGSLTLTEYTAGD